MSEMTETTVTPQATKTWDAFNLRDDLLRGIYNYGFEAPSEIQQKAIVPFVAGGDILAQAQSGSGKTGTFSISILQRLDVTVPHTQAIVLSPTHELAKQTAHVLQQLGSFMEGLKVRTLIGGTPVSDDASALSRDTPHVVVGCPGRVLDMMHRRHLSTKHVHVVCLDEADELLTGFKHAIYEIFQCLTDSTQVALFSATMPDDVVKLSETFMRSPTTIRMNNCDLNLECIHQSFIAAMDDRDKYNILKDLYASLTMGQSIIYANSVGRVEKLYRNMVDDGFSVSCIHSNMSKMERDQVFREFRMGACRVLISSNISARGIDVQQVSTVINFDIPNCVHTYLHRIGRSGRWGRKGLAINLVTRRDVPMLKTIETHYQTSIVEFVR